ncbi:MAG: hypothetical protein KDK12_08105 [Rhodobacteraceae bacterium]|nr:hypothetical protein [Paracoccaceae bacterium]
MRTLALLACLSLATPALAGEVREEFECSFLQRCDVGQACTEDATAFSLAFVNEGIDITFDGTPLVVDYDADLRTAAFRWGAEVMQLRFNGDGGGVVVVTPEFGSFDETRVMWMHCSPA